MVKMNRGQQKRAMRMLNGVLTCDLYRDCFPSLQGKSEEELLHFAAHAWRLDKSVSENVYNILCRLVGKDEADKQIF